ncbi:hypothetical protein [Streptomyces endophyticus]|uniref:Uncharacterized protein n=1 Tax=Streptomyces endophyticus TaxID=714166 RepID=A0ABU6FF94_9ACTN|nr:hypothetical protein [Streptomyces endophyticus]MEB8342711.1 hypothetical protein [Streptomyces endophyticus]
MATATATVRKGTAGAKVAAPGDESHPFGALQRKHAPEDEGTAVATTFVHRGPSGLPWLSGTTSVKVA